jgi:hypothetical protein
MPGLHSKPVQHIQRQRTGSHLVEEFEGNFEVGGHEADQTYPNAPINFRMAGIRGGLMSSGRSSNNVSAS